MTTSLTATGKVLVVSLMGVLILLVGFGLYLLIRPARRKLRAGGSIRDAPAWFGGPTYRELKPADKAAMVGLRIWRAFGLVLLAVGAGFTIFAVLTSGSKPRTQLLSAPVGHRLVFPDVRLPNGLNPDGVDLPDPSGAKSMTILKVGNAVPAPGGVGPLGATISAEVESCPTDGTMPPEPGDFELRLSGGAVVHGAALGIPGPLVAGACVRGPLTFAVPAGSVPISVAFPDASMERTFIWTIR
jgi:hypothetical protein